MPRVLDPVQLASELIELPSPSTESNRALAERVAGYLEAIGFDAVEWIDYELPAGTEKCCLVARRGTGHGGLAFVSHLDTVPAREYRARLEGDRLYGRGACDMKGPLAALLAAASRVDPAQQRAALYVICTADEEIGYHGARAVVQSSELFRALVDSGTAAIITEPTELAVVYGHKGTVLFTATARGTAAHSSTADGDSAVLKAVPFLAEMKAIHDEFRYDPRWHDRRFDPPWPGWNIVVTDYDTPVNVTAPRCTVRVGWRPMPGQPIAPVVSRVRQAAEKYGLELEVLGEDLQALFVEPDSPLVRDVVRVTGASEMRVVPYGTDGCVFGKYLQMVVFGPGSIQQAHRDDEYIELAQLRAGVAAYEALLRAFCC